MFHQRTTGLTPQQLTTLLIALTTHTTLAKPGGRPPALTLTQALKATLIYHRHNLTEELFNTSRPTILRVINSIEKALQKLFSPLIPPLNQLIKHSGSLIINGNLITPWNLRSLGKTNFSGKHKKAGFNHQVICTLDGKLLAITDPVPGARLDAYTFQASWAGSVAGFIYLGCLRAISGRDCPLHQGATKLARHLGM